MKRSLYMLTDIVGTNNAEVVCHPVAMVLPPKKGLFSVKPRPNAKYLGVTEADLRKMIERGDLDKHGSVRMVPFDATSSAHASALRVRRYRGKKLPLAK
jgi:hypothetical protein